MVQDYKRTKTRQSVSKYYVLKNFNFLSLFACVLLIGMLLSAAHGASAQIGNPEEMVSYEKRSAFIKEFPVPFQERGLRGITTDSDGNTWFYHSTNRTSTLVKFDVKSEKFTTYAVEGDTTADDTVINLAGGQLAYDASRKAVWFTDARTNSVGKLDIENGQIALAGIPTPNSGPMGIAVAPDGKSVWFAEIIGNNIAYLNADSMEIIEYPTGDDSGPALLTFDSSGLLWVSLSFSNSILMVEPLLLAQNTSLGMSHITLPEPDLFSPFGVAVTGNKMFLSDHGSSRVIVSDIYSSLRKYTSYWTSPSPVFPTTLPSQVVADNHGNIYFAQHGGNRIAEIRAEDGLMTEYEIPTGPLSTVVFLAPSQDSSRVWFTEWASNKIGYLDTTVIVPFEPEITEGSVVLDRENPKAVDVSITSRRLDGSPVSLSEVEIGLTGMSESGLQWVAYNAQPPRINAKDVQKADSHLTMRVLEGARPGQYTVMVRTSAPESDGLIISRLYPVQLTLDVPEPANPPRQTVPQQIPPQTDSTPNDSLKVIALIAAVGLGGYLVYRKLLAKRKI